MKLRLDQPVHSLDGPYGILGDIVIDPKAKTVTHLVIEPEHSHRLARLVPSWMVESDAGMWGGDSRVNVSNDQIPRGEVEIRNRSTVHSIDDHDVGHVSGIITLNQIASVHNDRIDLLLAKADFRALPKTDEFDDDSSTIDISRERVDAAVEKATTAGQHLIDRTKSALHRHG